MLALEEERFQRWTIPNSPSGDWRVRGGWLPWSTGGRLGAHPQLPPSALTVDSLEPSLSLALANTDAYHVQSAANVLYRTLGSSMLLGKGFVYWRWKKVRKMGRGTGIGGWSCPSGLYLCSPTPSWKDAVLTSPGGSVCHALSILGGERLPLRV